MERSCTTEQVLSIDTRICFALLTRPFSISPRELATCAMVCQSWARRSRSRQFKLLDFSSDGQHTVLSRFLDLISSPHTTIAPHVHHVTLVFAGGEHSIPAPMFMHITYLRALRSIYLGGYRGLPQVGDITAWLGSFANLTHMKLYDWELDSFSPLCDLVGACRRLESLHIYDVIPRTGPYYWEQTTLLPPQSLQVLDVKTTDFLFEWRLFDWLRVFALPLQIRSLSIGWDEVVRNHARFGRLVRALGPTLEELSVRSSYNLCDDGEMLHLSGILHLAYV